MDNNEYENEAGGAEQNDSLHRRLRVANAAGGVTLMSNKSNTNSSDRNGKKSDDSGRNSGRGKGKRSRQ